MSIASPVSVFTRSQSIVIDFSKWDDMLSNLTRSIEGRQKQKPKEQYTSDIEWMQKIFKESKTIKKGLNAYLDLLITENHISEIEKMHVGEIMADIKT
jgi:hypothetical protein